MLLDVSIRAYSSRPLLRASYEVIPPLLHPSGICWQQKFLKPLRESNPGPLNPVSLPLSLAGKCDNRKLSRAYRYCEKFIDIAREFDTIAGINIVSKQFRFDNWVSIILSKIIEIVLIETIKILKLVEIGSSGYPNRSICFDNSIKNYRSFYRNPVHDRYE